MGYMLSKNGKKFLTFVDLRNMYGIPLGTSYNRSNFSTAWDTWRIEVETNKDGQEIIGVYEEHLKGRWIDADGNPIRRTRNKSRNTDRLKRLKKTSTK